MRLFLICCLSLSLLVLFSGCDKATGNGSAGTTTSAVHDHEHDHEHDEDHEHEHAGGSLPHTDPVHKGHPIAIEGAEFAFTWTHSNSNDVIEIFVMNKDVSADMPIKADLIKVREQNAEDPQTFELAAVSPDADGKSAHFSLDSTRLNIAMKFGVEVVFEFDGKTVTGVIPPHTSH